MESAERDIFVGRVRELQELAQGFDESIQGRGRAALLSGGAGTGKTRLADEASARAEGRGFQCLRVACRREKRDVGLAPWREILGDLARDRSRPWRAEAGLGWRSLSRVVPELALEDPPTVTVAHSDHARFQLFDTATQVLAEAAQHTPRLLVLDDLHWSDVPSLLLLRFLARAALRSSRIFVIGAVRTEEIRNDAERAALLEDFAAESQRISLPALSAAEIAELAEQTLGRRAGDDLVDSLLKETRGNPLFVAELLRARHGAPTGEASRESEEGVIPERIRDVILSRVRALPRQARAVVESASVLGSEFDLEIVRKMTQISNGDAMNGADALSAAGVARPRHDRPGSYSFVHDITRDVLLQDVDPSRRRRLHHRAAEVLEHRARAGSFEPFAEIAHHLHEAGAARAKLLAASTRAAGEAERAHAYEAAAIQYARALDTKPKGLTRRGLMLARAAALQRAGDAKTSNELFAELATESRKARDWPRFARAALGYGVPWLDALAVDEARVALLEEALEKLPRRQRSLRARLLGSLATALFWARTPERRRTASAEAVRIARSLRHPDTLAYVLEARHYALWDVDHLEARLEAATEMIELAHRVGDEELELRGRTWRFVDLFELGDVPAARRDLEARAQLVEEVRDPLQRSMLSASRAALATLEGRFENAERLAEAAFQQSAPIQPVNAHVRLLAVQFRIFGQLGRAAELVEAFESLERALPQVAAWRCTLAWIHAANGELDRARALFDGIAEDRFESLPRDVTWLSNLGQLAEVCATLGDTTRADRLYDLILPFADRNVVQGASLAGWGVFHLQLGLLSRARSNVDEALHHFERALHTNRGMGARPAAAHAEHQLARLLVERRKAGDVQRAGELLETALATARELGMKPLAREIAGLRRDLPLERKRAPGRPETENTISFDDGVWVVRFDGKTSRLKNTKGMRYVAHLLSRPDVELTAVDFVQTLGGSSPRSPEQARVNATKAMRAAIRRIAAENPALGSYLERTIRTGATLRYQPGSRTSLRVDEKASVTRTQG